MIFENQIFDCLFSSSLDVFKYDEHYEENETKYKEIRKTILDESSEDESSSADSDEDDDEKKDDVDEEEQEVNAADST